MAKKSSKTSQSSRKPWLIAAAAVVGFIVIALMMAQNGTAAVGKSIAKISPQQYINDFENASRPHLLLDVRTPAEFANGHISGAVNISVETLQSRLSEVSGGQPVVVYCRSGSRSATASQILAQAGYSDIFDLGGINAWQSAGLPVE